MKTTFYLRGLAEGMVGKSSVQAASIEEVFNMYPALMSVQNKLVVCKDSILGFAPCDG